MKVSLESHYIMSLVNTLIDNMYLEAYTMSATLNMLTHDATNTFGPNDLSQHQIQHNKLHMESYT